MMDGIASNNFIKMERDTSMNIPTENHFADPGDKFEICNIEKRDPELFDPNEYISTDNFLNKEICGGTRYLVNYDGHNKELNSIKSFRSNVQLNANQIKCEDNITVIDAAEDYKLGIVKLKDDKNKLNNVANNQYIIRLCPFCGKEYDKLNAWKLHLEDDHDLNKNLKKCYTTVDNSGYQCIECKFLLKSDKLLRVHTISHLPYKEIYVCKICAESFAECRNLRGHIKRRHLNVVGKSLKENTKEQFCQYCAKTLECNDKLLTHIRNEHSDFCKKKILLVCPECGMNFRNNKTYRMHVKNVHKFNTIQGLSFQEIVYGFDEEDFTSPEKRMKYRCTKCNLLMPDCKIDTLRQHALTHLLHHKYKCCYCDFSCSSTKKLSLHTCKECLDAFKCVPKVLIKRKSIRRQLWLNRNVRIKTDRIYVCPSCGEEFDTLQLHAHHLKAAHGFENVDSLNITITKGVNSNLRHICNVCNKEFKNPTLNAFKAHAFSHMPFKIYKCTLCNSSSNKLFACLCKDSAILNCTSFICPQCKVQQEFKTEKDWHAHIEQCHPDFLTPNGLNFSQINLMKTEHPYYKCNNCDKIKKLLNINMMLLHAIEHMYTKCFKCEKCGNSYKCKRDALNDVYNCLWKKQPSVGKKNIFRTNSDDEKIFAKNWRTCSKFAKCQCPVCGLIADENDAELVHHLERLHDLNLDNLNDLNFSRCVVQESAKGQNSYTCLECNQALVNCSINQMKEHKLMHLPYRMWHCSFCERKFCTKAKVLDHIIDLHLKKKHKRESDVLSLFSFACPVCNEISNLYSEWRAHMNTKHDFNTLAGLRLIQEMSFLKCIDCNADVHEDSKFAHRLFHLPYSPYKCRFCNHPYKTFKTAQKHAESCQRKQKILKKLENIKKEKTPISSSTISKGYKMQADQPFEIDSLKAFNSIISHVDYACDECKTKFPSEKILCKHINEQHNNNDDWNLYKIRQMPCYTLLCKICWYRVKHKRSMSKHVHRKHLAAVELQCDICYGTSKTHYDFYTHMKTQHTDIASWPKNVCPICVEILPVGTNIELHTRISHLVEDIKKYEKEMYCQLVGITVQNERTGLVIKAAEVVPCGINPSTEMILPENYETIGQSITTMATCSIKSSALNKYILYITYACPECNLQLPTQIEWHTHIATEHDFFSKNSLNFKDAPGGKSICLDCGTPVKGTVLKQNHKLIHMPYRSFICKMCFHRSKTQNGLYDHMKRKHFLPGSYKCEMCTLVFQTACERYTHAKEVHKDIEWPANVCPVCVMTLSRQTAIDEHMKTHRIDRVEFPCRYCGKKYLLNHELTRHLKEKHCTENEEVQEIKEKVKRRSSNRIRSKSVFTSDDEDILANRNTIGKKSLVQAKLEIAVKIEAPEFSKRKRGMPRETIPSECIKDPSCILEKEPKAKAKRRKTLLKTFHKEETVGENSDLGSYLNEFVTSLAVKKEPGETP